MFSKKSNPDYLNADLHQVTLYNLKTRRWQTFKKWVIRLSLLLIIILGALFYGRYSLYLELETKRNNDIAIWLEQCEAFHSRDAIKPAIACYKEVLKRDRHHPLAFQNLKVLENQYFQDQNSLIGEMQLSENFDNEPPSTLADQVEKTEHVPDNPEERPVVPEGKIATTAPLSSDNAIPESIELVQADNEPPTPLTVQLEKNEQVPDKLEERPVVAESAVATVPKRDENETDESEPTTTASKTDDKPIPETIERAYQDNELPTTIRADQVEKTEHVPDKLEERPVVAESAVATVSKMDGNQTDETESATTIAIQTDEKPIPETIERPYQDNEPHTKPVALAELAAPDNLEEVSLPPIPTTAFQTPENQGTEQIQFVQPPLDKSHHETPVSTQVIEKTALGPANAENKPVNPPKADTLLSKKDDNHKSILLDKISDQVSLEKQPLSLPASGNRDKVPDNVVPVSKKSEPPQSAPLISKKSEPNQENKAEKSSALDMLLTIAASIHNESRKAIKVPKSLDEPLAEDSEKPRESKPIVLAKFVPKQPIKEAMPRQKRTTALLQECETHFEANRLMTGKQGTAFKCYHQVLALDAYNAQAKQGLLKIEGRYQYWAEQALRKGKRYSAEQYIQRLQKVNALSPGLPKLQQHLSHLEQASTVTQPPLKARIKTSMPPSKARIKSSQLPIKEQRQKATYQPAKPPLDLKWQCGDILAQESLGIRPLTQEQKVFKNQSCD